MKQKPTEIQMVYVAISEIMKRHYWNAVILLKRIMRECDEKDSKKS